MVRPRGHFVIVAAVAVMAMGWTSVQAAPQVTIADSVAEFSGTQGQNNWYYGYTNVTTYPTYVATPGGTDRFTQLPWYGLDTSGRWAPWSMTGWQFDTDFNPWTALGSEYAHPNGTDKWSAPTYGVHWAIRRYVSEAAGTLIVNWILKKDDTTYGNGVTGRIFHNGVQEDSRTIAYNDATGVSVASEILNVQIGDFIDLALDATGTHSAYNGGAGNGQDDLSKFTATITVPEPATLSLLALGGLATLLRRRR